MKQQTHIDDIIKSVCDIDYINDDSFPVRFEVQNGNTKKVFEAGLCFLSDEYEAQYFAEIKGRNITILDIQDPDNMVYGDIVDMIKTCCKVDENSIISLNISKSYNGTYNDRVPDLMDTDDIYESSEKYYWKTLFV